MTDTTAPQDHPVIDPAWSRANGHSNGLWIINLDGANPFCPECWFDLTDKHRERCHKWGWAAAADPAIYNIGSNCYDCGRKVKE